jgi:hypothetical protein
MFSVFQYKTDNTHMPFIFEYNGTKILLLSINNNDDTGSWNPAYTDWDNEQDPIHPLNIKYNHCACNLHAYVLNNKIILSYITFNNELEYCLYQTDTMDMINFSDPILLETNCWTGFAKQNEILTAYGIKMKIIKNDTVTNYRFLNFKNIYRISPISDNKLVITSLLKNDKFATFVLQYENVLSPRIYQINNNTTSEIYKSTIYDNTLVLAIDPTNENSVRNRKLFFTDQYDFKEVTNNILLNIENS